MRNAFVASPGHVWASIDYAAQEIRVAAALSQDQNLLQVYFKEKEQPFLLDSFGNVLVDKNGNPRKNPETDVYIQTGVGVYPFLADVPLEKLEEAATSPLPGKGPNETPRRKCKTLFLGIIYGMAAAALAARINVTRKEAEKMIDLFFAKYPSLEKFLTTSQFEARHQRYVKNALGRIIFVNEANAKGQSDLGAVARKGANAKIQSLSADITKLGMVRTHRAFQVLNERRRAENPNCAVGQVGYPVHDELNALIPGSINVKFVPHKKRKDLSEAISYFNDPPSEEEQTALEYTRAMQEGMEDAMSDILSPIIRDRFGVKFPAKAEINLHLYWKH